MACRGCRKLPHPRKPLAGTVECNACGGFPVIQRHTPDILGAFKMGWPWDFEVSSMQTLGGCLSAGIVHCCHADCC